MDNELPYRTPFTNNQPAQSVSFVDEQNYDSLRAEYENMGEQMERLLTWATVDLKATELKVKQQIWANRTAYDILLPIYQSLETAIGDVKAKQESRY